MAVIALLTYVYVYIATNRCNIHIAIVWLALFAL